MMVPSGTFPSPGKRQYPNHIKYTPKVDDYASYPTSLNIGDYSRQQTLKNMMRPRDS